MASEVPKRRKKRITVKPKKPPNPLFEKWLEEWKNKAASKGSDMQYCFGKALSSLRKYPLPLKSGRDCGVLNYFGNRLCIMLDHKLAKYKKTHPERW
jgi:crossover junction endonuclease MUS81